MSSGWVWVRVIGTATLLACLLGLIVAIVQLADQGYTGLAIAALLGLTSLPAILLTARRRGRQRRASLSPAVKGLPPRPWTRLEFVAYFLSVMLAVVAILLLLAVAGFVAFCVICIVNLGKS